TDSHALVFFSRLMLGSTGTLTALISNTLGGPLELSSSTVNTPHFSTSRLPSWRRCKQIISNVSLSPLDGNHEPTHKRSSSRRVMVTSSTWPSELSV